MHVNFLVNKPSWQNGGRGKLSSHTPRGHASGVKALVHSMSQQKSSVRLCVTVHLPVTALPFSPEGFYLLADSSQYPYNTIQTRSRQFPKTRGTKLSFHYFMQGDTVRELSVIIQYGEVSKEIWKLHGSQGREWKKADVVYFSPTSYNVTMSYIFWLFILILLLFSFQIK